MKITAELARMAEIPRAAARRLGVVRDARVDLTAQQYAEVLSAKTLRLPVSEILAAAPTRRPGYIEACMSSGTLEGEWIKFTAEEFIRLRASFGGTGTDDGPGGGCGGCGG